MSITGRKKAGQAAKGHGNERSEVRSQIRIGMSLNDKGATNMPRPFYGFSVLHWK